MFPIQLTLLVNTVINSSKLEMLEGRVEFVEWKVL